MPAQFRKRQELAVTRVSVIVDLNAGPVARADKMGHLVQNCPFLVDGGLAREAIGYEDRLAGRLDGLAFLHIDLELFCGKFVSATDRPAKVNTESGGHRP